MNRRNTSGSPVVPVVLVGGGLAAVQGLTTLAEYAFDRILGVDQLLRQHYIGFGASLPVRMAPRAARCSVLAGAGPRLEHRSMALGWQGGQQSRGSLPRWLLRRAGICAVTFMLGWWQALIAVEGAHRA